MMQLKEFIKFKPFVLLIISIITILGSAGVAYGNYLLTAMANALKAWDSQKFVFTAILMPIIAISGRLVQYWATYYYTKIEQAYLHDLRKKQYFIIIIVIH